MALKQGMPRHGELVICTAKKISQFAAWCNVEEYGIEGMIHISEVAGKWVHDIKKFVKAEKQYIAKVVKIDPNAKTVDLSLKRVSKSEEKSKWNQFRREQRADSILKIMAHEIKLPIEQVYEEIKFPLLENFGSLYSAFVEIKKSPEILEKIGIPKKWHDGIVKVVQKSLVDKEYVIKAELQMQSYASDGIRKIKSVLETLEKKGINVTYISAPKYLLEIKTKSPKADGRKFEQDIEKAIEDAGKLSLESKYSLIES